MFSMLTITSKPMPFGVNTHIERPGSQWPLNYSVFAFRGDIISHSQLSLMEKNNNNNKA